MIPKKRNIALMIIVTIPVIVIACGMYNYYAPPMMQKPYIITRHDDDTLHIAYIGDSWAFLHQPYDEKMSDELAERLNRPVKISSHGYCGRNSKDIYKYFFNNPEMKHFISKGYEYCIISAGINDSNKKMSTGYYKKSMDCIIRFMLTNDITPILLEIPDYDIEKMFRWEPPSRKLLRRLSCFINSTPMDCKKEFRKALDELISEKRLEDQVQIIRYKAWNSHFSEDQKTLYREDGVHLNEKGYAKLDSCIIESCIALQTKTIYGKN